MRVVNAFTTMGRPQPASRKGLMTLQASFPHGRSMVASRVGPRERASRELASRPVIGEPESCVLPGGARRWAAPSGGIASQLARRAW
jgi:hypothetical protein